MGNEERSGGNDQRPFSNNDDITETSPREQVLDENEESSKAKATGSLARPQASTIPTRTGTLR